MLKGRQNYLCRHALHGFELLGGQLFPRAEDGAAFDAMRGWIDTTETGDRAELEFEPPETIWIGARRRRRPLPRPVLRVRRQLLHGGGARPGLARRARDREPRPLLRRSRRCAAAPTRRPSCRSTTRSSSTRRTGWRSRPRPGSAAGSAGPSSTGCSATSTAPAARRPCPFPRGRVDRVEGSALRLLQAVAPESGRRRLREIPAEPAESLRSSPRRARRRADRQARRGRRRRGPGPPARGRRGCVPRGRRREPCRLGRARPARLGAGRRGRGAH